MLHVLPGLTLLVQNGRIVKLFFLRLNYLLFHETRRAQLPAVPVLGVSRHPASLGSEQESRAKHISADLVVQQPDARALQRPVNVSHTACFISNHTLLRMPILGGKNFYFFLQPTVFVPFHRQPCRPAINFVARLSTL